MAKIKNVELKSVKATLGREGYGFTANVYVMGKKVGSVADYGDGSICLDINIPREKMEEVKKIAIEYYKEHPKYGVDINDEYILNDFFNELYELKDNETIYKKNAKKGFDKMIILAHSKREEDPMKDTNYIYSDIAISCRYQGETPSKKFMEDLEKEHPNNRVIIAKYHSLDDFIIE